MVPKTFANVVKRCSITSGPNLSDFIHKSAVLKQYRQFLRAISQLDYEIKNDLQMQIRAGFDSKANVERNRRREVLQEGQMQLKQIQELAHSSRTGECDSREKRAIQWPWEAK